MSTIDARLDHMTLAEQVSLLSGRDFWSVTPIERLEIGALRVTDGPNGARGGGSLIGGVKAAAFPVGIALGATWDRGLLAQIGAALADEVKSKQAHVLLAPTVNIQRSVTNGRNFECYAEDPYLTAELAVNYITGLQGEGIGATIKHFVGNESEVERFTMSSEIDERSLREVYLLPFERAVKEAEVWAVMSSYNRLNGTYTSEHSWLLTDVLRGDWGFDGVVMSDWFGSHSTAQSVNAGLDLEMPGPARDRGDKLIAAVERGEVAAETVRKAAGNVLRLMQRTGAVDDHRPFAERAEDRPETRALIRRAGAQAAVLLQNDGILPLLDPKAKIALIGPNARAPRVMGGGSAQLNAHRQISLWDGLKEVWPEADLRHAPGCTNHRFEPVIPGRFRVEWFDNTTLSGTPVAVTEMDSSTAFWTEGFGEGKVTPGQFSARLSGTFTPEASGCYRVGLASAGLTRLRLDGAEVVEAWDSWTRGGSFFDDGCSEQIAEIALEAGRRYAVEIDFAAHGAGVFGIAAMTAGIGRIMGDDAISDAAAVARAADVVILCLGRSAEWDTEGSDLPGIALPGRQDELARAVMGANPRVVVMLQSGGPVEMPWIEGAAAVVQGWYPGQEAGLALADVLTGAAEPGGRLPQSFPRHWADNPTGGQAAEIYPGRDGHVRYGEGVFFGHRHYEREGVKPLFPFGFGLSYTQFALSDLGVEGPDAGGQVTVRLRVTNTGTRVGRAVVQLYVSPAPAPVERPLRELKGFERVKIAPGEAKEVTLTLGPRDFAWFDVENQAWQISAGTYGLHLGLSSADLPLCAEVVLSAGQVAR